MVWQGLKCAVQEYLIYRLSSLIDVIRYLVTFVVYLRTHAPASQALQVTVNDAHTGTPPAVDWKPPPGRPRSKNEAATSWSRQSRPDRKPTSHVMEIAIRPGAGEAQQCAVSRLLFLFLFLGWHTLPSQFSYASAEACVTGWPNTQPQGRD